MLGTHVIWFEDERDTMVIFYGNSHLISMRTDTDVTCLSSYREKEMKERFVTRIVFGKRCERKKIQSCDRYNKVNCSGQGDRIEDESYKENRRENACGLGT